MDIVILDGHMLNPGDLSWDFLSEFGRWKIYGNSREEEVATRSEGAAVLIVNKVPMAAGTLQQLPGLQYIIVSATGYNNLDINYCRKRGIAVSNIVDYGSATVAQHVFALILALTNRVEYHHRRNAQGAWRENGVFSYWDHPIAELAGKTFGIIGMGNIGRRSAAIASGFGMRVIYYSRSGNSCEHAQLTTLEELTATSDIISLHTHLDIDNTRMVNKDFLAAMKESALLINTARGGLVHEEDLRDALEEGTIAGAGLDVLAGEPPPDDHCLLHLPNCIVTPHNAWASVEARSRMMNIIRELLRAYRNGSPFNLVS